MKALKSILPLSKLMWLPIWCRAFSFLLTILQILLLCSSNFSCESKVIPSNFSLGLDAIDAFAKRISLCVFELKITWHFSGLAFNQKIFSNSLKLRNYRWYILCTGIGSIVISVATNVIILTLKKQVKIRSILNSSGPSTEPYGTPYLISLSLL